MGLTDVSANNVMMGVVNKGQLEARRGSLVIVEVGSYTAAMSIAYLADYGGSAFIYEPSEEGIDHLRGAKDESSVGEQIKIYQKAVTGLDGEAVFYYQPSNPMASTMIQEKVLRWKRGPTADKYKPTIPKIVPTVSMETVIKENKIGYLDLLLLNCEGSEWSILEEFLANPQLYEKVGQMVVALHNPKPHDIEWRKKELRLVMACGPKSDMLMKEPR